MTNIERINTAEKEMLAVLSEMEFQDVSLRWLRLAKTHTEIGAMAARRAIEETGARD